MALEVASRGARGQTHWPRPLLFAGSVQVGGKALHYAVSGADEAGPAVLFLHESGGHGATWQGQLSGLAQTARCLVPDLPGHGHSEGQGCDSIAGYRDAMLGFLDALSIRWPVLLVGVCLGAAIAVEMAAFAPQRVAGLLLVAPSEGGRAGAETLAQARLGEASDRFVAELFTGQAAERLKAEQVKRWRMAQPTVRYSDLMAVAHYPLTAALAQTSQPLVLVGGEHDHLVPPLALEQLAATVGHGQVLTIPEAGCLAMLEQPNRFNEAVARFAAELQPALPSLPTALHRGGYRRS